MQLRKVFTFLFILFLPGYFAFAEWVWSPQQGKFVNTQQESQGDVEELFDSAMELYKQKSLDKATDQLENLLKKYPKSRLAPEAQYRLGTIWEERGDLVKAHKAYQNLIKSYPQTERFEEVIEREFNIGNFFLSGKKGKVLGLELRPSLPLAVEVFKSIVEVAPYSNFGDKAQFNLGLAYQKSGQYDNALEAYQALLDQYPKSDLLQKARLQMAETSYAKSSMQSRDQSALDEASKQAERYLTRYPDSEEAQKAAKIRQEIDEKNAEKNYRIGLYYENENYLESALIYYADTAKRYPDTSWGQKASDKLRSLKEPTTYIPAEEQKLRDEAQKLETELQSVPKSEKNKRQELEKQLDTLHKKLKSLEKGKTDSLDRRKKDIKRREQELKEKYKELERKKKRYKNNTSEDFQKAIHRWQSSLDAERDALAEEKDQLKTWRAELGVKDQNFYESLMPFVGEPDTPVEKVRQIGEKELYKLSKKKKELLEKKEKLYKQYTEAQAALTKAHTEAYTETGIAKKRLRGEAEEKASLTEARELSPKEKEIAALKGELNDKLALYEEAFGKIPEEKLLDAKKDAKKGNSSSVKGDELKEKNLQELLELKMHLTEKIAVQRNIVDTLNDAFNKELARKEHEALAKKLEQEETQDVQKLRKEVKRVEKDIRARYQDIQDRHEKKKQLLKEMDELINPKKPGTKAVVRTLTGPYRLAKAFIFGLPNEDVELTQSAEKAKDTSLETQKVKALKEQVELESLMIEAQMQEIAKLEKKLEMLKAQASLAGGYKFRSSLVKVPYAFIEEAVESARRVVPKKNRQDVLINRLNRQTQELEALNRQLETVKKLIQERTPATVPAADGAQKIDRPIPADLDEKTLREQIQRLQEQLEVAYSMDQQEKGLNLGRDQKRKMTKDQQDAEKKMADAAAGLLRLIDEEIQIEESEQKILQQRIEEIDRILPSTPSKAMQQDLLTEKERVQERLSNLSERRNFLSQEKERFTAIPTSGAAT